MDLGCRVGRFRVETSGIPGLKEDTGNSSCVKGLGPWAKRRVSG